MITLWFFLCWNLSILSCWDSFWLLCIKWSSSKETRVSNIFRMLVVWWATSTTYCQICNPCLQMSLPSESFSSPLSPTGQQVTAVLSHQILLWEIAFYYDMADDWSKNQLWNWLCESLNCLSQYTPHFNLKLSLQLSPIEYFWEYMPLKWLTHSANIVLQVFPFSLFL